MLADHLEPKIKLAIVRNRIRNRFLFQKPESFDFSPFPRTEEFLRAACLLCYRPKRLLLRALNKHVGGVTTRRLFQEAFGQAWRGEKHKIGSNVFGHIKELELAGLLDKRGGKGGLLHRNERGLAVMRSLDDLERSL